MLVYLKRGIFIMLAAKEILKILNSKSKWLSLLVIFENAGISGRKVAQETGLAWAPVKNALDQLQKQGLLERKRKGKSYLYFPNKDHYLFPILKIFFKYLNELGKGLFHELAQEVFSPQKVDLVSLKVCDDLLLLIIEGEGEDLTGETRRFLQKKGLSKLKFKLIPVSELQQQQKVIRISGKTFGADLEALLKPI